MATTIVPSIGAGALYTQQGTGTTPGYSGIDDRRALLDGAQEGVIAATTAEAGGWMCTQHAAGANNQIDIAANVACAKVQGDSVVQQGLYTVAPHSAVISETITPADATNPRVDSVILEVLDNVLDASGSSLARTRVVAGTPTPAATVSNRSGAPALPSTALLLADFLVPANGAGTVTLSNSQIRDRRKWARGAECVIVRQANASASNDYSVTSSVLANIDSTNLAPRIECSGVPVELTLMGGFFASASGKRVKFAFTADGAQISPQVESYADTLNINYSISLDWKHVPTPGSHTWAPQFASSDGATSFSVLARAIPNALVFGVREIVSQNVANNTVTSA